MDYKKIVLTKSQLFLTAIFGAIFGFVEAAAIIYIRSAGFQNFSSKVYQQPEIFSHLPHNFLILENFRELGTIAMIICMAFAVAKNFTSRLIIFLWIFSFGFLFFYLSMLIIIKWPSSFLSIDFIGSFPAPWYAPVYFPVAISFVVITFTLILKIKNQKNP